MSRRHGSRWVDAEGRQGTGGMDLFMRSAHSGVPGDPLTVSQIHSALEHPGDRRKHLPHAANPNYGALGRSDPLALGKNDEMAFAYLRRSLVDVDTSGDDIKSDAAPSAAGSRASPNLGSLPPSRSKSPSPTPPHMRALDPAERSTATRSADADMLPTSVRDATMTRVATASPGRRTRPKSRGSTPGSRAQTPKKFQDIYTEGPRTKPRFIAQPHTPGEINAQKIPPPPWHAQPIWADESGGAQAGAAAQEPAKRAPRPVAASTLRSPDALVGFGARFAASMSGGNQAERPGSRGGGFGGGEFRTGTGAGTHAARSFLSAGGVSSVPRAGSRGRLMRPASSQRLLQRPRTALGASPSQASLPSLLMRVPEPLLKSKAGGVSPYQPVSELEPWVAGSPEVAAEAKAAMRHASLVERSSAGNTQSSLRLLIAEMMLGMQHEFTASPQLSTLSQASLNGVTSNRGSPTGKSGLLAASATM